MHKVKYLHNSCNQFFSCRKISKLDTLLSQMGDHWPKLKNRSQFLANPLMLTSARQQGPNSMNTEKTF